MMKMKIKAINRLKIPKTKKLLKSATLASTKKKLRVKINNFSPKDPQKKIARGVLISKQIIQSYVCFN